MARNDADAVAYSCRSTCRMNLAASRRFAASSANVVAVVAAIEFDRRLSTDFS